MKRWFVSIVIPRPGGESRRAYVVWASTREEAREAGLDALKGNEPGLFDPAELEGVPRVTARPAPTR